MQEDTKKGDRVKLIVKYATVSKRGASQMMNIKPVSDLRNYNKLIKEVTNDQPVFLTKNGRGMYVIVTIEEYDRVKASIEMVEKLKQAESSGVVSLSDARKSLGL